MRVRMTMFDKDLVTDPVKDGKFWYTVSYNITMFLLYTLSFVAAGLCRDIVNLVLEHRGYKTSVVPQVVIVVSIIASCILVFAAWSVVGLYI